MENNSTTNQTLVPCVLPHEITDAQWDLYYAFLWWLEGFATVLIGSIGTFLNLITVFVLLSGELAASFFNWLLVCLAVFDIFFLLNGILEAFRNHFGSANVHAYVFAVFLYPFRSIVMCCSMYTTVLLALERYNALANPISHQSAGFRTGSPSLKHYFKVHLIRLLKYIGPIIIMSTIFNIPKWLELEVATHQIMCTENNTKINISCGYKYGIVLTGLRSNSHYNLWYQNIVNLLITAAIPLASLSVLNLNIYFKFKQYLQRQPLANRASSSVPASEAHQKMKNREKDMIQQTMILFSVVILFALSHILRIVLNIEEFSSLDNRDIAKDKGCEWLQYWTIMASSVSHLLLHISSSINFVIYCYFNKSFRGELISWINAILNCLNLKCSSHGEVNLPVQRILTIPDTEVTDLQTTCLQEATNFGTRESGVPIKRQNDSIPGESECTI